MLSATVVFAEPLAAAQQTGSQVQVLIRPLATQQGATESFGRKVSQRVRDRLRNIAILTPISEEAVEDELDRLELNDDGLGLSEWRQLAGRLDADLLLYGTLTKTARGHDFQIFFIDVGSGEATSIPLFTVNDDVGRERNAADRIMDAMESQVEYERAKSTTTHYLRGRIEMSRENWQAAKESFALVIEANPAHVDALTSLGYTEAKLGNRERAHELYDEVLGFNRDAADVRMQIAYDLARAGDYEGAVGLLRDGLARDPTNADMRNFLAEVLLNQDTAAKPAFEGRRSAVCAQR